MPTASEVAGAAEGTARTSPRITGRPEAAAAIWTWQVERSTAPVEEMPAAARRRGVLRAGVVAALGILLLFFWSRTMASVVFGVAGVILLSALLSPLGLYAGLEHFFAALGRVAGRGLAWILFVPIFYLFFLPFGLLFRRGQRDRLKRRYESETASYWEERESRGLSSRRNPY